MFFKMITVHSENQKSFTNIVSGRNMVLLWYLSLKQAAHYNGHLPTKANPLILSFHVYTCACVPVLWCHTETMWIFQIAWDVL